MSETHINISSTHSIRKARQAAHSICETLQTTCRSLRGSVAAQEFLLKTNFQSEILTLESSYIKPDTPINVYTRFCLNTAKSKFSLVSPVADW